MNLTKKIQLSFFALSIIESITLNEADKNMALPEPIKRFPCFLEIKKDQNWLLTQLTVNKQDLKSKNKCQNLTMCFSF